MKHGLLAVVALAFWPIVGHGRTPYFTAIALAAIRSDARRA